MKPTLPARRIAALLSLLVSGVGFGQSFTLDWARVAGGGGTSTDGFYALSGTIGQPEAGRTLSGGIYSITGGAQFESDGSAPPVTLRIVAVHVLNPGNSPEMQIIVEGTPGHAFQLQFASALAPAITWSDLGAEASASGEGRVEFIDPGPPSVRFYRITESLGP